MSRSRRLPSSESGPRTRVPVPSVPYHHGDLKNAILAGAIAMVEAAGAEALSLRAVAKSIGVSEAAPYHHFADKRALEQAVAGEGFRRLAAAMSDGDGSIRAIAEAYIGFALGHPGLFQLMFRPPRQRDAAQEQLRAQSEAALAPIVQAVSARCGDAAVPADVTGFAALAAWSSFHGFAQIIIAQGLDRDPGRYQPRLERLARFFEDGLIAAVRGQQT